MAAERQWRKSATSGTLGDGDGEGTGREAEWVWVDVEDPDEQSLNDLARRFDLDELALEDALDPDLFPRYEDYGHFVAISIRGVSIADGLVETTPLLCLVGSDFLVTFHHEPLPGLEFVVDTAKTHPRTAEGGPDRMMARLADAGSRRFEPVIDEIDALLEDCEVQAIAGQSGAIPPLQAIRKQVARLRGVIRPQRSLLQSLVYADSDLIGERARRRLTDVLERHARIGESLESARAMANGVIEVHRGAVAERANEIMKVLTIFSATLLPMTLIAGIYGMNFAEMPELDYRFGYPIALGVMASIAMLLWRYFARRGFVGRPKLGQLATSAASRLAHAATQPVRTVGSLIAGNLVASADDADQGSSAT